MTFTESVSFCLTKGLFRLQGRASRSEFWWFQLFKIISLIIVVVILGAVAFLLQAGSDDIKMFFLIIFNIVFWIGFLIILIASFTVQVRRLHDLDLSGWWLLLLLLCFIPYLGFLISLGFFVLFMFKGTEGYNSFGENPLESQKN